MLRLDSDMLRCMVMWSAMTVNLAVQDVSSRGLT